MLLHLFHILCIPCTFKGVVTNVTVFGHRGKMDSGQNVLCNGPHAAQLRFRHICEGAWPEF